MGNQSSQAQLDTLFADNDTGDITPARLRDLVESCVPSRGVLRLATALTNIVAVDTPVKASNTTVLSSAKRFSMPLDNRLLYDGPADAHVVVTGIVAVKCAAAAQDVAVSIAKNGAVVAVSSQSATLVTANALYQIAFEVSVDVAAGDYLEVWVANETSDADVTIDHGSLRAIAFLT